MKSFTRWLALAALFGVLFPAAAGAVGTRRFELREADDFKGGELEGVAIDATGRVRPGFNLGSVPIAEGSAIWSVLPQADGSALIGTGNEGKLVQVQAGKARVVGDTKALVVTSLAPAWGGSVAVATLPDGKIFRFEGGKLTELVTLKDTEHVWQIAFDPKTDALYAATGPQGKLWRVDRTGNAQVFYDAEEQHLMSVAVAADGTVYAGASDKAKLYRIAGPGRAEVLYDFGRTEVRGIAVAAGGVVFAIANEITAGSHAPKRKTSNQPAVTAQPVQTSPKIKGKGTLYRFDADGTPHQLLDDKDEHFTSVAVGDDGVPYVGTGAEGRVYSVDAVGNPILVADTEEHQVSALSMSGKQRWIATSDPAVLHPVRGIGGPDAVWTSKVLDAGLRARFGKMRWITSGSLEFSTRTGNTAQPDDTWSAWSPPLLTPGVIASPPGRFFQVRARWSKDPDAVLHELDVPFVTDNLRAMVTQIDATGGSKKKKSDSKDGLEASGGPIDASPETELTLTWKVDNPDKDELRYRLQYQLVGTDMWFDILPPSETLTKDSYAWDTAPLPEGQYRVRVIASDELSNPPGRATRHERQSGIILVDNTPPSVEGLRAVGRRVQGTAIDGVGPIQRIEISVSGQNEWHPFFPSDGIFDEQRETFDADVSSFVGSVPAMLSVRVFDQANNFVVRNVIIK